MEEYIKHNSINIILNRGEDRTWKSTTIYEWTKKEILEWFESINMGQNTNALGICLPIDINYSLDIDWCWSGKSLVAYGENQLGTQIEAKDRSFIVKEIDSLILAEIIYRISKFLYIYIYILHSQHNR